MVNWKNYTKARNVVPRRKRKQTRMRKPTNAKRRSRMGGRRRKTTKRAYVTRKFADMRKLSQAQPLCLRNTMRYQDYQQTYGVVGLYLFKPWRLNGIYDPDARPGLTGTTVVMYDDLTRLYTRNTVNSCFIKMRLTNLEAHSIRVYFVCALDIVSAGDPQAKDLTQDPGFIKYVDLMPGGSGSASMKIVTLKIDIKKKLRQLLYPGTIPASFYVSDLWATTNSLPAQQLFMQTYFQSFTDDPAHAFNFEQSIDIRYDTTWAQPNVAQFSEFDFFGGVGHGSTGVGDTMPGVTGPYA